MSKAEIIGKYEVLDTRRGYCPYSILTDNPIEAIYEANKFSNRTIINRCGEMNFIKDGDKWKIVR